MVEAAAIAALLRLLPHSVHGGVNGTNYGGTGILCLRRRCPGAGCASSERQLQSRQGHAVGAGPPRLVRGVRKQKIWVGPVIFPLKRQRHFKPRPRCRWCDPIAVPTVRRGIATTWARMASALFTRHRASFRTAQSELQPHNSSGCTPGGGTSVRNEIGVGRAPERQRIPGQKNGRRHRQSAFICRLRHAAHRPSHRVDSPATSTAQVVSRTTNRQPMESARRNPPCCAARQYNAPARNGHRR